MTHSARHRPQHNQPDPTHQGVGNIGKKGSTWSKTPTPRAEAYRTRHHTAQTPCASMPDTTRFAILLLAGLPPFGWSLVAEIGGVAVPPLFAFPLHPPILADAFFPPLIVVLFQVVKRETATPPIGQLPFLRGKWTAFHSLGTVKIFPGILRTEHRESAHQKEQKTKGETTHGRRQSGCQSVPRLACSLSIA